MAGRKTRIDRRSVAELRRGDWLTDNTLPGFKVRRPNRHALYGLNIRLNGRMRWYSIGSELDLTPDQARAEAERLPIHDQVEKVNARFKERLFQILSG